MVSRNPETLFRHSFRATEKGSPRFVPISPFSSDLFQFAFLVFGNALVCSDLFRFVLDASFLLTVEVFLLTVRLFYLWWRTVSQKDQTHFPEGGNRKQKLPNLIAGPGGAVSKKTKPIFHRKQKRPNRISTVSKKDQAN